MLWALPQPTAKPLELGTRLRLGEKESARPPSASTPLTVPEANARGQRQLEQRVSSQYQLTYGVALVSSGFIVSSWVSGFVLTASTMQAEALPSARSKL